MKLSTRARYGTRALLDLALHSSEGTVPLKDIAQRQKLSLPYLQLLITPLIAGEIVKTSRGSHGGILLLKAPQEIRLSEVVQLLEGSFFPMECINHPGMCPYSDICVTHDVWDEMKKAMDGVLETTTLQDLVERQKQKQAVNQSTESHI